MLIIGDACTEQEFFRESDKTHFIKPLIKSSISYRFCALIIFLISIENKIEKVEKAQ